MKKDLTLVLFFSVLLFIEPGIAKAQVSIQDSLALVDLYNSTNGPNWIRKDKWLSSEPVATWYGVHVSDTIVHVLHLDYNQLSGHIPSSIGNLKNLSELYLDHNQLSGRIPPELGQLNLHSLYLDHNQLSGRIPPELGLLHNLYFLNLSHNQLSGSIPSELGLLHNLYNLRLNNNKLSGNIPASFTNLNNAKYLQLGYNKLRGVVPSFLADLRDLEVLGLRHNYFNFDGLEQLSHDFRIFNYEKQRRIHLYLTNNVFSVYAGGTLSNNTYKWFKNGAMVATVVGDSTYEPTNSGNYTVQVTNSIATELTLYSDTITYSTLKVAGQNNVATQTLDKTNFSIYPNPAKTKTTVAFNVTGNCIIKLTDISGRILQTKTITAVKGQNTLQLDVSKYAAGVYFVIFSNGKNESRTLRFSKE